MENHDLAPQSSSRQERRDQKIFSKKKKKGRGLEHLHQHQLRLFISNGNAQAKQVLWNQTGKLHFNKLPWGVL